MYYENCGSFLEQCQNFAEYVEKVGILVIFSSGSGVLPW